MKKITSFLMLFLMCFGMSAWAQYKPHAGNNYFIAVSGQFVDVASDGFFRFPGQYPDGTEGLNQSNSKGACIFQFNPAQGNNIYTINAVNGLETGTVCFKTGKSNSARDVVVSSTSQNSGFASNNTWEIQSVNNQFTIRANTTGGSYWNIFQNKAYPETLGLGLWHSGNDINKCDIFPADVEALKVIEEDAAEFISMTSLPEIKALKDLCEKVKAPGYVYDFEDARNVAVQYNAAYNAYIAGYSLVGDAQLNTLKSGGVYIISGRNSNGKVWIPNEQRDKVTTGDVTENSNFPNCKGADMLWYYYCTAENGQAGRRYLYNIGSGKFVNAIDPNVSLVPLAETPNTMKFDMRTTTVDGFPIKMSSKIGGEGCFETFEGKVSTWDGGWSDTGSANGAHRFQEVTISQDVLDATAKIVAERVNAFEDPILKEEFVAPYRIVAGAVGGLPVAITEELVNQPTKKAAESYLQSVQDQKIQFDPAKLYRIQNYKRMLNPKGPNTNWDRHGQGGYLGTTKYESNNTELTCGTNLLDDAGTIWKFEKVDQTDTYRLKNLNNGKYIGSDANKDAEGYITMQETVDGAGVYTIELTADLAEHKLKCGNQNVLHVSTGHFEFYDYNDKASRWYLFPATELEVAMNSKDNRSYSTLHVPFAVSMPEGVEAYIGSLDATKQTLTMHAVTGEIPANTGLVLKDMNNQPKVTLNILASTAATVNNNAITGTNTAVTLNDGDRTNYYVFGLRTTDQALGFYHPSAKIATLKANKAFINTPVAAVNGFRLDFGDLTGIEHAIVEEGVNAPIYDLSGRRVMNTVKGGIYIQNGKKFIVK